MDDLIKFINRSKQQELVKYKDSHKKEYLSQSEKLETMMGEVYNRQPQNQPSSETAAQQEDSEDPESKPLNPGSPEFKKKVSYVYGEDHDH